MEELTNKLTLAEIDQRITRSAVEAVIEIGYYLKQIGRQEGSGSRWSR